MKGKYDKITFEIIFSIVVVYFLRIPADKMEVFEKIIFIKNLDWLKIRKREK